MDITIRAARLSDVATLLELYKALDVGSDPELSMASAQQKFENLTARPEHRIYVAQEGERIVGTFALIFLGGLAHGALPSCVVEDVVVVDGLRGRGIGKLMMRCAMQACADEKCYKLVLSSHVQREQAHRYYEGLGFRRHGYSFLIDPVSDPLRREPRARGAAGSA